MKNSLKQIIEKIKLLNKAKAFKKEALYIDTNSYWRLLILLSVLIVLTSFGFGYFLFNQISTEVEDSVENVGLVESINKSELQEALDYFKDREKKTEEIITSQNLIKDPSI